MPEFVVTAISKHESINMKFFCTSDWHLRATTPKNRIDDFSAELFRKVDWIYNMAYHNQCSYILRAGDLTNSATLPYSVTQKYIDLFLSWKEKEVIGIDIAGQHDMRYHSNDLENTPIMTFAAAKSIILLGRGDMFEPEEGIHIYGAGWNDDIPEIEDPEAFNILIIHSMMISEKIWYGQENYDSARKFLKDNNFDLIVSGDNHKTVVSCVSHINGDKWLLNTGSLMRQKSDQMDHKPCIFIFDTETRKSDIHYIPCKDISQVMNIEKISKEKEQSKELNDLKEKLNENVEESGLDYLLNLRLGLSTSGLSEKAIEFVERSIPA
ncbi:MAG: metallophosphoesterase [Candidatus Cloacimonas sp.]